MFQIEYMELILKCSDFLILILYTHLNVVPLLTLKWYLQINFYEYIILDVKVCCIVIY